MGSVHNCPSRRAVMGSLFAAPVFLRIPASLAATTEPSGKIVIAFHVTISPAWFDPSLAPPQITPFGILYALHDALVRAYPGTKMGPALAEHWEEDEDGRTYEFKLRPGLTFHNGDPVTAEDVKFSFDRYKGAGATVLKEKISDVEIADPLVVRFHLKEAWPDFMTVYGSTASAAGLVVPKKYIERVGEKGFGDHPIGAGPYKFVSGKPGIEVVLEAFPQYWRHVPNVKTIVIRSVPDSDTRALMVKTGEADIAIALQSVAAQGLMDDPKTRIVASKHASCQWIEFPDQYDPKSPWHDKRMRLAVAYAIDREGINKAACLGFCPPAGVIVPRVMPFALQVPPFPYDPEKSKQLLAEAGYPNGIDAGLFRAIPGFPTMAEAVVNDLNAVGIRVRLAPMERAAFYADWKAHKFHGLFMTGAGNAGNAASRVEAFIYSKGAYASGGYPDIDQLYLQQDRERDPKKREATIEEIQQMTIDRVMFAPVFDFRALNGIGPRIAKDTVGDVYLDPFPEYEDIELKSA
ncbi:MAG: ABC transporter substrate-binding protein [Alphaproteobacteria bacterium]|nr:ABC transporter substrate-binding protein [Alphaproteobacteria bacterium]